MEWIYTVPLKFETYGKMLKFMRESKKITQAQLARKLKTNQSAIARIENSKRPPSLRMMMSIAKALKLEMTAPDFSCKKCHKRISGCKCNKK